MVAKRPGRKLGAPGKHGSLPMISNRGRFCNSSGYKYVPKPKHTGYSFVSMVHDCHKASVATHRMVHIVFNDPGLAHCVKGATIDHRDKNASNNASENLRWATKQQQALNRNPFSTQQGHRVRLRSPDGTMVEFASYKEAAGHIGADNSAFSRRNVVKGWVVERVDPDLLGEEWRVVPDHTHLRVSNLGRVATTKGDKRFLGSANYAQIADGQLSHHILVAFGFPRPSVEHTADHKDRDIHNNRLDNLHWATRSEQNENRVVSQRSCLRPIDGKVVGCADWTVYQSSVDASKQTGVAVPRISNVINPKARTKTAPGANGVRYEFRNHGDGSQSDLPGEQWKVVDPLDWCCGGKYHSLLL